MKFKKLLLWLSALALLGIAGFVAIQLYIGSFNKQTPSLPQVDAILVLGAYVNPQGQPSLVLKARLDNAYELYQQGIAPKLLLSGDHGKKDYDEVKGMRDYLLNKGVPREDIFLDHAGFDTFDSMYRARDVFCVESMVISTQEFHMARSLYIARRLGLTAYGYSAPDEAVYNMTRLNIRESFARVKAFFDVEIFKAKPKYLGDEIPIWGNGIQTEGQ